jgi:ATP-dependent RNA helicase SUPV3L1/SUV3
LVLAASGRTSFAVPADASKPLYRVLGFRVCGTRAVRVDILERLADLIRPAIAYRPGLTQGEPPAGAADGDGFTVTVAMTSLVGCAGEDFSSILRSLGYRVERRAAPPPPVAPATEVPVSETAVSEAPAATEATPQPEETGTVAAEAGEGGDPQAETAAEPAAPVEVENTAGLASAASEAPAEAQSTPAEAEPAMIEIWHPGRRGERPSRPAHRSTPARSAAPAGAKVQPEHERPERERNDREHHGRGGKPQRDRPERDGEKRHGAPRGPSQHRDRKRGDLHAQPNRQDMSRRDEPKRETRRERQPDPDSPFAALAALKSRLDGERSGDR